MRGRTHYVRRSLLSEFLRGSPQPQRLARSAPMADPPDSLEAFERECERELDQAIAEAENETLAKLERDLDRVLAGGRRRDGQ